jgi:hypothetical protein
MLIDMVSKVQFKIYHVVDGIVEYRLFSLFNNGLNDITLRGFTCLKDMFGKLRELTFQSV